MSAKLAIGKAIPFSNLHNNDKKSDQYSDEDESNEPTDEFGVTKETDEDGHTIGWRNKSMKKKSARDSFVLNRHGSIMLDSLPPEVCLLCFLSHFKNLIKKHIFFLIDGSCSFWSR